MAANICICLVRASLFRYSEPAVLKAQTSSGIKKRLFVSLFCTRLKRRAVLVLLRGLARSIATP